MADSPAVHQVGSMSGEINVRDLLCGIVRSCCHLVGADHGVLCVSGADRWEVEVYFLAGDTPGSQDQDRRRLSLEVPVHLNGDLAGRLGFSTSHDRNGHDCPDSAAVAAGLAAMAGNVIRLAGGIRSSARYVDLAETVVRDLFKLGFDLHMLDVAGPGREAVTTTIAMIGQAIRQIQAVVLDR